MARTVRRKVLWRDDFGLCVSWPKTHWGSVPKPGKRFTATVNGRRRRLRVETERCTCRGRAPHEHRFLVLPGTTGLAPNGRAIIELL